jgi:hypothetical protein
VFEAGLCLNFHASETLVHVFLDPKEGVLLLVEHLLSPETQIPPPSYLPRRKKAIDLYYALGD